MEGSESVNVRVDVWPAAKESSGSSSLMAMVGLTVSMVKRTELLGSASSLLVLPAASEKAPLPTETTASVLLLSGWKIAE